MCNTVTPGQIRDLKQRLQALDDEMVRLEAEFGPEHARARNLLHYVALRRHDLREIQLEPASLGLSSLGRTESHVRTSIHAILRILTHLAGKSESEWQESYVNLNLWDGRQLLERHTEELLGPPRGRRVRIMVTMPAEAASDYAFVRELLESGMDCMRINCAHDGPDAWAAMIRHLRQAEAETGLRAKIEMDLAGPKLRTGPVAPGPAVVRLRPTRDPLGRAPGSALPMAAAPSANCESRSAPARVAGRRLTTRLTSRQALCLRLSARPAPSPPVLAWGRCRGSGRSYFCGKETV